MSAEKLKGRGESKSGTGVKFCFDRCQQLLDLWSEARFGHERDPAWEFLFRRRFVAGANDYDGRRPSFAHHVRQRQPIHVAGHTDISENDADVVSPLKNINSLSGTTRLDRIETGFLSLINKIHSDE